MSCGIAEATEPNILSSLSALSTKIVGGATLEESLDFIFDSFGEILPYERIGFAEIDINRLRSTARWARSRGPILLKSGYSAPLLGSSLSIVLERRQPRVLNDLPKYLQSRPESRSTRLIVREGIQSSMTCPLFVNDLPFGFLFFSSSLVDAYTESHVKILCEIGNQLATLLMTSEQKAASECCPEHQPNPDSGCHESTLSGLRPGMVLAAPLCLDDGLLLLAAGSTLTRIAIERLITLHTQGFVRIKSVMVT